MMIKLLKRTSLILAIALASSCNDSKPIKEATEASKATDTASAVFESQLQQDADTLSEKLPILLNPETRWDKIVAGPGKMNTYHYTLLNLSSSEVNESTFSHLYKDLANNYKNEPSLKKLWDNEVHLKYVYSDTSGNKLHEVTLIPSQLKE